MLALKGILLQLLDILLKDQSVLRDVHRVRYTDITIMPRFKGYSGKRRLFFGIAADKTVFCTILRNPDIRLLGKGASLAVFVNADVERIARMMLAVAGIGGNVRTLFGKDRLLVLNRTVSGVDHDADLAAVCLVIGEQRVQTIDHGGIEPYGGVEDHIIRGFVSVNAHGRFGLYGERRGRVDKGVVVVD